MGELRDFVYIDDISLNSNLSSLGRGVPSEVVRSSEGETEKSGEAGAKVWGIGAKGRYSGFDRNAVETTLQITAPYRFQDLIDELDENDIDVYENPDPRSVARGDVVRIDGSAKPMSLFKFEVTVRTIRELLNSQTIESLEELDEDDMDEDVNSDEIETIQNLIEQFTGDKIPIRMEGEDWTYGTALNRDDMRLPPSVAFLEEPEYTIFGRVEQRILDNNTWDPILATNIIDKYLPEDSAGEEMREGLEETAEEMNLSMEPEDWELPGHTLGLARSFDSANCG
jgi:hypothetical protein